MIIKRRFYFSLIEVLITLVLATLLITAILFFVQQMVRINQKTQDLEKESFQKVYLESRLFELFSKIHLSKNEDGNPEKNFAFFTEEGVLGKSLVFAYLNRTLIDPHFSSHVLSRLYIDGNKNLCLATWPGIQTDPQYRFNMNREILMVDIDALDFMFYVPPPSKKEAKIVETAEQNPSSTENARLSPGPRWEAEWKAEYKRLPAILELTIRKNQKAFVYRFPLTDVSFSIEYEDKV